MKQVALEIMTKKIITIGMEDSVRKAYQVMQENKIRHLPVVDSGGDIIGIISNRDLQRSMTPTKTEAAPEVSLEFDPSYFVRDFMSWPIRTVPDDSLIQEVAITMLKEKISAVIVVGQNNSYRGIITTDDLVQYLADILQKEEKQMSIKINYLLDNLQI